MAFKNSVIYKTVADAENGTGYTGEEGKSIYAEGRIYIHSKKENRYKEYYVLKDMNDKSKSYVCVSDVQIDPDL